MPQDPRSLLQLAEERRKSGRLKEAIAVCLDGLIRHPNLDAVRVTLGRAYLDSGQSAEARDALQEVFARQPDHHLAGKLLAEARRRLGDFEGAATTCREILRHYPRDREVEAILASLGSPPSDPVEAVSAHSGPPAAAGACDPSPDYLPEDVAPAGAGSGRPPEALASEPRSPGDALQTNTLADLYLKQGLIDRALEVYRGMLRLDPDNEPLRRRVEDLERPRTAATAPPAPLVRPVRTPAAPPVTEQPEPIRLPEVTPEPQKPAIARLERWLVAIRSGSEGDGTAGPPR